MNITFTPQPIPALSISGNIPAGPGFIPDTPLQLTLRPDGLWISTVTDSATRNTLCEASQQRRELGGFRA